MVSVGLKPLLNQALDYSQLDIKDFIWEDSQAGQVSNSFFLPSGEKMCAWLSLKSQQLTELCALLLSHSAESDLQQQESRLFLERFCQGSLTSTSCIWIYSLSHGLLALSCTLSHQGLGVGIPFKNTIQEAEKCSGVRWEPKVKS